MLGTFLRTFWDHVLEHFGRLWEHFGSKNETLRASWTIWNSILSMWEHFGAHVKPCWKYSEKI